MLVGFFYHNRQKWKFSFSKTYLGRSEFLLILFHPKKVRVREIALSFYSIFFLRVTSIFCPPNLSQICLSCANLRTDQTYHTVYIWSILDNTNMGTGNWLSELPKVKKYSGTIVTHTKRFKYIFFKLHFRKCQWKNNYIFCGCFFRIGGIS